MVLISGNNKSALQHANDPRSKAQGVTAHHNPHHQGNKNIESARLQNSLSTNLTKGMTTTLDEFKYGFPSDSLSTTSNKWWGSSGPDDYASKNPDGAEVSKHSKGQLEVKNAKENADTETCETGKDEESSKTLQGTALLKSIRKRAVEEGREALKLGVFQGYGVKKLGKREKILLLQIFGSSLPRSWLHDS